MFAVNLHHTARCLHLWKRHICALRRHLSGRRWQRAAVWGGRHVLPTCHPTNPCLMASYSTKKERIDMSEYDVEYIRNFSIIAHVDHGKSTLADRLLEITGCIPKAASNKQVLDKLQVERERGITVKAQTASLFYTYEGKKYLLNLIDTPGHVDFSYEVSRSLSACQGVLLVVDANEGIQAQTVANFFLAFEAQLSIIPVINKIDLKNADPERVEKQIEKMFDIPTSDCIRVRRAPDLNALHSCRQIQRCLSDFIALYKIWLCRHIP